MKRQNKQAESNNYEKLFTWTKKLLSRDGFKEMKSPMNTKERFEKLDANDKTFTNSDPDFDPGLNAWKEIIPENYISVKSWNPVGDTDECLSDVKKTCFGHVFF